MRGMYYKIIAQITFFSLLIVLSPAAIAQEKAVLFHEDFSTLENWSPLTFPKIAKHTIYTIEHEGKKHFLKAASNSSASAIRYKASFNVFDYPRARWRWKVSNVYSKGDPRTKKGDDYPIRVYLMFDYDPDRAGTFEKIQYGLAKKLYGEYPPHSSLNYVWASTKVPETIITSPYTDRVMMVLLRKGAEQAGAWLDEDVDILSDYRKAFGATPPGRARIAVMNDSDNTGERSTSYLEFIEVYR